MIRPVECTDKQLSIMFVKKCRNIVLYDVCASTDYCKVISYCSRALFEMLYCSKASFAVKLSQILLSYIGLKRNVRVKGVVVSKALFVSWLFWFCFSI